jgi:hypothetical protein
MIPFIRTYSVMPTIPLVVHYFKRSHTDSMFTMTPARNMGVLRTNMRFPCRVTNRVWSVLTQFGSEATSTWVTTLSQVKVYRPA